MAPGLYHVSYISIRIIQYVKGAGSSMQGLEEPVHSNPNLTLFILEKRL